MGDDVYPGNLGGDALGRLEDVLESVEVLRPHTGTVFSRNRSSKRSSRGVPQCSGGAGAFIGHDVDRAAEKLLENDLHRSEVEETSLRVERYEEVDVARRRG